MYIVIHIKTGTVLGYYKTMSSALRKCDKVDNEYGAVCTRVIRNILL